MSQETVRTLLRLMGVVTILVGAIMCTNSLASLVVAGRAMNGAMPEFGSRMGGMIVELGTYSLLANALIIGEGLLLFLLSPKLAEKIVE